MLVSDLIRYRNDVISTLSQINLTPAISDVCQLLHQLGVTHPHNVGHDILGSVQAEYEKLIPYTVNLKEQLPEILNKINDAIDLLANTQFPDVSLEFFKQYHRIDFQISDEVIEAITVNIRQHSNFYYPALQFGCTAPSMRLTNDLVASDPLYLCDFNADNVETIARQFNDVYYGRLKKYIITDSVVQLPQNQFGFIFSWMLFNYTSMTCIKDYLKKMLELLRPGGIFLFSYNNCDQLEGCELAETGGMSYVPKRHLLVACQELGYELAYDYDLSNVDQSVKYISWLAVKKPGTLATAKRHPVLGEIKQK